MGLQKGKKDRYFLSSSLFYSEDPKAGKLYLHNRIKLFYNLYLV